MRTNRSIWPRLARLGVVAAIACAVAGLAAVGKTKDTTKAKWLRFEAYLQSPQNSGWDATLTGSIVIGLDKVSSDADRQALLATFREEGNQGLLTALQKMPRVGYIVLPNRPGFDIHFARQTPLPDGGTRYVMATNFPQGLTWAQNPDAMQFPFLLIEIRMPQKGFGQGKVLWQTKLVVTKDNGLGISQWADEPTSITAVKIFK